MTLDRFWFGQDYTHSARSHFLRQGSSIFTDSILSCVTCMLCSSVCALWAGFPKVVCSASLQNFLRAASRCQLFILTVGWVGGWVCGVRQWVPSWDRTSRQNSSLLTPHHEILPIPTWQHTHLHAHINMHFSPSHRVGWVGWAVHETGQRQGLLYYMLFVVFPKAHTLLLPFSTPLGTQPS